MYYCILCIDIYIYIYIYIIYIHYVLHIKYYISEIR